MERCTSGKRIYESESLAEEALIQNHIFNNYRAGEGPRNFYPCEDCGYWHFTSKGEKHFLFSDPDILKRIKDERRSNYWERHLR